MVEDKLKYLRSDFDRQTISSHLDELENLLGKLDSNNAELAELVLMKFDLIESEIKKNNPDRQVPFAYQTQLEYVENRIRSHAQVIINAMGGTEQYISRRDQAGKKEDSWWWYLDRYIKENQKKNFKKILTIAAVLILLSIVVIFIYQQFFAPPPEVLARIKHEQAADRLISDGNLNGALLEIQSALSYEPENYELLIWQGVVYQQLGDNELSQQSFQHAENIVTSMEEFYLTKTYYEFNGGLIDQGFADAQKLIEINPESAEGYLYIGQVYEIKGAYAEAYQAYETASELAEKSDNTEMIATIKIRMGMLLQTVPLNTPLQ
jgi:tetratricopeptide (TPR) repeat protein